MVEAAYDPRTSVADVAECFKVSPAQLYSWRRQIADHAPEWQVAIGIA
jgi:transposase-like protein